MKLKEIVESKVDKVFKYVFITVDNQIAELSYIDKDDGKDIICVPTQTMCNQSCKFCQATSYIGKIKVNNLTHREITSGVEYIKSDRNLGSKPLLVSYMGIGEPMCNVKNVISSMVILSEIFPGNVRFAIATSLPSLNVPDFCIFMEKVKYHNLNVKLHLSLHYTNDKLRHEWMPLALNIRPTIDIASFYKSYTGNNVEVHYAMIDNINDKAEDAIALCKLLENRDFSVKLLYYTNNQNVGTKSSDDVNVFMNIILLKDIPCEYYIPVGLSIGASCGAFNLSEY